MEVLGYLHAVQRYEALNEARARARFAGRSNAGFNAAAISGPVMFALLTIAWTIWILGLSRAASAADLDVSYAGGGYYFVSSTGGESCATDCCGSCAALVTPAPVTHPPAVAVARVAVPSRPAIATLSYGDKGPAVVQLQDTLRRLGYFAGPSTGYFGFSTQEAVIAFQQNCGLCIDGVVGLETLAALQRIAGIAIG